MRTIPNDLKKIFMTKTEAKNELSIVSGRQKKNTDNGSCAPISDQILLIDGLGIDPKDDTTTDTLVFGGPGTGKTFNYAQANIAQLNTSYIIFGTSTHGSGNTLLQNTGGMLHKAGYTIWHLNFEDPDQSHRYNPLDYVYNKNGEPQAYDIVLLASTLVYNLGSGALRDMSVDETNAVSLWLAFIIMFVICCGAQEKRNLASVTDLTFMPWDSPHKICIKNVILKERKSNSKAKCFKLYDKFMSMYSGFDMTRITSAVRNVLQYFSTYKNRVMTSTEYAKFYNKETYIKSGDYFRETGRMPGKDLSSIDIKNSKSPKSGSKKRPAAKDTSFAGYRTLNNISQYLMNTEKTALFITAGKRNEPLARCFEAIIYLQTKRYKNLFGDLFSKQIPLHFIMDGCYVLPDEPKDLTNQEKYNKYFYTSIISRDTTGFEELLYKRMPRKRRNILFYGSTDLKAISFMAELIYEASSVEEKEDKREHRKQMVSKIETFLQGMEQDECILCRAGKKAFLTKKLRFEDHPSFKESIYATGGERYNVIINPDSVKKVIDINDLCTFLHCPPELVTETVMELLSNGIIHT